MASKGILFLCISLAVILMITSDAAARDLADTERSRLETSKIFMLNILTSFKLVRKNIHS